MSKLLVSIDRYAYLEAEFAAAGGYERGVVERKRFPDGERYLRLVSEVWGRDVVLLGGTPNDDDWLEVYDLGYAISRAGARSLSIVMPYFGYATMERAVLRGEVVTAKTRARLVSALPPCEGGNRVFLFDLHTDGIAFYFGDSHVTQHLYGESLVVDLVADLMRSRGLDGEYVLGATDAGRAKWVQSLARRLGVLPAFVYKSRDAKTGDLAVTGINADVAGREVVIYDDMIRTGGSLVQAARAYLDAGATKVHAVASHLVLPGDSLARIRASGALETIRGTNSHPGSLALAGVEGAVVSVATLFASALERPSVFA